jgi:hypothetical protein
MIATINPHLHITICPKSGDRRHWIFLRPPIESVSSNQTEVSFVIFLDRFFISIISSEESEGASSK